MALNNNFYSEIFEKELYWTELAKKNLLNIYYLNGKNGLKEFYEKKRIELSKEYQLTNNPIQAQFLEIINNIINKIETLSIDYRNGKNININSLVNIFLSSQMNNNSLNEEYRQEENNKPCENNLPAKKRILENLKNMYMSSNNSENENYLYDDFDFDQNKKVV